MIYDKFYVFRNSITGLSRTVYVSKRRELRTLSNNDAVEIIQAIHCSHTQREILCAIHVKVRVKVHSIFKFLEGHTVDFDLIQQVGLRQDACIKLLRPHAIQLRKRKAKEGPIMSKMDTSNRRCDFFKRRCLFGEFRRQGQSRGDRLREIKFCFPIIPTVEYVFHVERSRFRGVGFRRSRCRISINLLRRKLATVLIQIRDDVSLLPIIRLKLYKSTVFRRDVIFPRLCRGRELCPCLNRNVFYLPKRRPIMTRCTESNRIGIPPKVEVRLRRIII